VFYGQRYHILPRLPSLGFHNGDPLLTHTLIPTLRALPVVTILIDKEAIGNRSIVAEMTFFE
jgi:hypothetical protein